MITDKRIFDIMEEVVRDKTLTRAYPDTLQQIIDDNGQPYIAYFLKGKTLKKAKAKLPVVHLARLVILSDGQCWLGQLNSWVRDDERGKKIQEVYETVYQEIDDRWAHLKEKK